MAHLLLTLCYCTACRTNARDLQAPMSNNCTFGPRAPASSLRGFVFLLRLLFFGFLLQCLSFPSSYSLASDRIYPYWTIQRPIVEYTINSFLESMSSFQVHTANPGNKTCKERSQYTREQAWENLKEDVKYLYVTQRLDLRGVQARLRLQGKYNFEAT